MNAIDREPNPKWFPTPYVSALHGCMECARSCTLAVHYVPRMGGLGWSLSAAFVFRLNAEQRAGFQLHHTTGRLRPYCAQWTDCQLGLCVCLTEIYVATSENTADFLLNPDKACGAGSPSQNKDLPFEWEMHFQFGFPLRKNLDRKKCTNNLLSLLQTLTEELTSIYIYKKRQWSSPSLLHDWK